MTVLAPASERPARPPKTKKRKRGFVERTLSGISANIESAVFSEENARRNAFLQRRDPRAKLVAFTALVIAAGISRDWRVLGALYLLTLWGIAAGDLDARSFLKRVWLGIPLFSGIVVLPSIFFISGRALFHIPLGFATLTATRAGAGAAGIFVLRVATCVSLGILLVLTTRWADILKSLRFFRVPTVFVLILGMSYRYIFLVLHTVNGMFESRKSRIVAETSGREQRWWIVASMSVLLSRSFRMSDNVYQAMLARGFTGQVRTLTSYRMGGADWGLVGVALIASVAAIAANGWLV
ncbi:MAG: cobalt ECF transporter T component CbiQ [Dehalococcoidia bacterium]|nr:cobalt ECF transporter T component CbiQ [Dehalococcoidia bacterium]